MSAVVINWNGGEATRACLHSLASVDYPNLSIIVVDNGSSDGSADDLAQIPSIDLVRNEVNLGFTGGVNTGMRRAIEHGADYVWLLNSDATTGPTVLGQLVAAAERDPLVGLVSPVVRGENGLVEFWVGRFDQKSGIATQTNDPAIALEWRNGFPHDIVLVGTALLVRRILIDTIGMLDDRFFAYVEDVDYSLRASEAGFRNVVVPDSFVYHAFKRPVEDPGSVPLYLHYYITRNYLLLWRKLGGGFFISKALLWFLCERMRQISRMPNDAKAVDAVLSGVWDGAMGIGGCFDPVRRAPAILRLFSALCIKWMR